jgi:hypothetical protein
MGPSIPSNSLELRIVPKWMREVSVGVRVSVIFGITGCDCRLYEQNVDGGGWWKLEIGRRLV